jgi:CubicO group peptidase (beta-lactamase class C family)
MSREMDNYYLPGAAVAVVQNEQILLVKGYGMADMDKGTSVDAQKTIFPIGSVTKLFTWTLVMQMVEQGQLDLNADINTYLVDD